MRYALVVLALLTLPACITGRPTMVSSELLPGYNYRAIPNVHLNLYDDIEKLQAACMKVVPGRWIYFDGCASVPRNPDHVCHIYVMRYDLKTRHHEMGHCHGYADTHSLLSAHPDYLTEAQP
jgi:hypothetical protein